MSTFETEVGVIEAIQPRLIDVPMAGLYPIPMDQANRVLEGWGHRLGPVFRPFHGEAYGLEVDGGLVAR